MDEAVVPAREVFRHFSPGLVAAFYVLSAAALAVFAYGAWQRVQKYRRGQSAARWTELGARLCRTVALVGRHATLRKRDALAGWSHALIFWGFVALFVGTLVIMVDHDVLRPLSPALQFWKGTFYLWYSVTLDLLGAGFVLGLLLMAARRWWLRVPQLDYTRPDRGPHEYDRRGYLRDDQLFLWGLFWIGVTGFAVEGLRIAADRPPFEVWSVVGWQVGNLIEAVGVAPATASVLHLYVWWLHGLLALAFVAYLPYSKAVHMVVDLVNLLFHDPDAGKRLPAVPGGAPTAGYEALTDFTWKELLDLDACTKCGRCHVACPARASGAPLSPRDLILELREAAEGSLGGGSWLHETAGGRPDGPGYVVTGSLVRPETLWACTTCLACVEACPVGIEHVPLIVKMRRKLVEDGVMDGNLQSVLEKLGRYGNSFGQSERNRARWTQGLPFKIKDARKEPVELLWFVGDFAAYDPGLQDLTRGVARVFQRAGLDFGILYDAERNSGNDVRRVGEEGLYQSLVEKNLAALSKARFAEIVTTDPHAYNTLRFEYPEFGGAFRVRHYTEVILGLLETGRLPLARRLSGVATYHDPCYLGRYAGVTEPPRAILEALGLRLVDMPRNRANSFCCGAGGGRIWMGDGVSGERPSEQRIKEALGIPGLEYFVVACPKDVTMYRDAVKTTGHERRLAVRDLIELVEAALVPVPAEAAAAPAGAP